VVVGPSDRQATPEPPMESAHHANRDGPRGTAPTRQWGHSREMLPPAAVET